MIALISIDAMGYNYLIFSNNLMIDLTLGVSNGFKLQHIELISSIFYN